MITPKALSFVLSLALACGGTTAAPPAKTGGPEKSSPFDAVPPEPSIAVTGQMGSPHVGDVAPDFELSDQAGAKLKLSSLLAHAHGRMQRRQRGSPLGAAGSVWGRAPGNGLVADAEPVVFGTGVDYAVNVALGESARGRA
jgi:hypothetical protein